MLHRVTLLTEYYTATHFSEIIITNVLRTVVFQTNVISLQSLYITIFVACLSLQSVKGTLSYVARVADGWCQNKIR